MPPWQLSASFCTSSSASLCNKTPRTVSSVRGFAHRSSGYYENRREATPLFCIPHFAPFTFPLHCRASTQGFPFGEAGKTGSSEPVLTEEVAPAGAITKIVAKRHHNFASCTLHFAPFTFPLHCRASTQGFPFGEAGKTGSSEPVLTEEVAPAGAITKIVAKRHHNFAFCILHHSLPASLPTLRQIPAKNKRCLSHVLRQRIYLWFYSSRRRISAPRPVSFSISRS